MANFFAQSDALMNGKPRMRLEKELEGGVIKGTGKKILLKFTFQGLLKGNKPTNYGFYRLN